MQFLKRLFTPNRWTVVKSGKGTVSHRHAIFWGVETVDTVIFVERNQWDRERAYLTDGINSQSLDLNWAKHFLGLL